MLLNIFKSDLCEIDFTTSLGICIKYILDRNNVNNSIDCEKYSQEIKNILMYKYLNGFDHALVKLTSTEVFKKAVGEVERITDKYIIVKEN